MKRLALILILAACTPGAQDTLARGAARLAIRPVLAEQFPGVPLEPAADCIIDNATSAEILALAADAVTGPTASTAELLARIASRPEAVTCLAEAALRLGVINS